MSDREQIISTADYARLRQLIYDETGIALGAGKQTMLEGRIRRRLKALAIASYREYCSFLFSDHGLQKELVHLIDAVTTNKTDFFREPRHFDFLVSTVLPEHVNDRRPFLLWSAACSSGEEPYTLAMVLSEFGLTHAGFSSRILRMCGVYSCSATAARPVGLSYPLSRQRFWGLCGVGSGRSTTMASMVAPNSLVS